jgi:CDK inhibitor PHO81
MSTPMTSRPLTIVALRKTASSTSLASKDDATDTARFSRKFGKHIQKRQLEIPEYAASFVDYKALKKVPPPHIFVAKFVC